MSGSRSNVAFSSALRRLLCDHQTFCSVDCCKGRAFHLSESSILRWLDFERIDRRQEIAREIERIEAEIRGLEGHITLAARGLRSEWDADDFRAFWTQFRVAYGWAIASPQRRDNL